MGIQNSERRESALNTSEKILLYSVYYAQLIYVLIIWIFTWDRILTNTLPISLIYALLFFIFFSGLSIIITYKSLIPKMLKKDDAHLAFFVLLMVMMVGSDVPSVLGLIYAIFGLIVFNTLYWQIGLLFMIFGFSHGIYLHVFKIRPFLNNPKNK